MNNLRELLDTVVENDYCIGCGICASLPDSPLTMKLNEEGKYEPIITTDIEEDIKISPLSVCPFAKDNNKEKQIGNRIFGDFPGIKYDEYSGYFLKTYAGYVKESDYRAKGSSGGMGNWIAAQLLKNGIVDGIIHVKPSSSEDVLFEYQISNTIDELSKGAKSKYYPIEMSKVLQFVRENEGKYALIGIPCYIKGVRLLADQDKLINERIKFFIGLVCGHLKSDMFAKSLGWEMGINPDNLKEIDFRKKLENRPANRYGVEVKGIIQGEEVVLSSPTSELYTTNWGHGMFKYNACEFCDDVLAETADITVGDAWLPEYSHDSKGTNVIVVRHPDIQRIIDQNMDKTINVEEISSEKVYQSQAGGFRHRRDGLAYRLYLKDKKNEWRPNKRVEPSDRLPAKRKKIYELRSTLSHESFKAYKIAEREKDFDAFIQYMNPLVTEYNNLNQISFIRKVFRKIKREVVKTIKNNKDL